MALVFQNEEEFAGDELSLVCLVLLVWVQGSRTKWS